MIKYFTFLFIFLPLSLWANAPTTSPTPVANPRYQEEGCNNYNLSKQFPTPSRDQDSTGWCFSFVAADIISAQIGKQVSAADIAMNYFYSKKIPGTRAERLEALRDLAAVISNTNDPRKLTSRIFGRLDNTEALSGGFMKDTIQLAQINGACLEKDFPSEDYRFSKHMTNIKDLISRLDSEESTEIPDAYNRAVSDATAAMPGATEATVRASLGQKELDPFSALSTKLCKNRIPFNFNHFKSNKFSSKLKDKDYALNRYRKFALLNQNFSKQRPVAISYKSDILYDPEAETKKGWHASILIGQRFNPDTKTCEVLLRNSWGDCSYAHSSYHCDKNNGHIWMPRDVVLKNTRRIDEAY